MTQQTEDSALRTHSGKELADVELSDLNTAQSELEEKGKHLDILTSESLRKMNEVSKINHDLQTKVKVLQELSMALNQKNDKLKRANQELEKKTENNNRVSIELEKKLERVLEKERELALQRDTLAKKLDETTQDLVKAEKFAIIGELSARLAHDLRNPLSVIKNTMDVMSAKQNLKIEEKLQYLTRFNKAVQRMSHQIDDVLDFVKKTNMTLQNTSLLSIMDNSINSILIPSNVKIYLPTKDVSIVCDSRKLEAVFSNIMLNGIQAIDDSGEVNIRITDFVSYVQIEFEDTGPGIPDDIVLKIFDPLFTTKQSGTGLGLSICANIIEQHRGTIGVKSHPTIFTVKLPKNLLQSVTCIK